ncbi:MAG: hypothetical protein PHE24_02960 [Patescibacteria group bacterium]|nr:hypothetical protein [Patescibacteria group bacterium]
MEKNIFHQFESDYLNRIVSTVKKSEEEQSREIKNKRIVEIDYKDHDQIHVENEKIVLDLGYEDSGCPVGTDGKDFEPRANSLNWRKLNNYSIKSKQSETMINLLSELPRDYEVFFEPYAWYTGGKAGVKDQLCIVRGDITTVDGLLGLLHEIGHCVDYEQTKNKRNWRMKVLADNARNEEDMEFVLRRERGAWAYALKKIKPLIRDQIISQEDVMLCVNDSVYSYHEFLGDKIKKEEEKEFDDKIVQAVDDFFAKLIA